MRKRVLPLVLFICAFVLSGCETTGEHTKRGAVTGGLLGAAAGGIIGHQKGRGLEGAAIGAAAGALGGALYGSAQDEKARAANPSHISIATIAEMASRGVPDSVIIDDIRRTNSVYELSSETIAFLKENGASDRVIDYMLSAE